MSGTYGLKKAIERSGAVKSEHFIFASGRHGLQKIEFDIAVENPTAYLNIAQAVGAFASRLTFDAYVGIKTRGEDIADMLGIFEPKKQRIKLQKTDGSFAWETPLDAYVAAEAENILIVDDVLTKGTNINKVANAVGRAKSQYLVVVQRSDAEAISDIPGVAILDWPMPDYDPRDCPHPDHGWEQ